MDTGYGDGADGRAPQRSQARVASTRLAKQLFFAAAFMSFVMSVYLFFSGDSDRGIFVGLWVPSILSAGTLLLRSSEYG